MENQHRKISGYRELTQDEIDLINEIKAKGKELAALIDKVSTVNYPVYELGDEINFAFRDLVDRAEAGRWASIAKTHLQQGIMALTRAVAKPEFF